MLIKNDGRNQIAWNFGESRKWVLIRFGLFPLPDF
jgi:hypothetical protein